MQGGVAAAAAGGGAHVAGAPPLLVAAVIGDLEDAALVEVEAAAFAFQALQRKKGFHVELQGKKKTRLRSQTATALHANKWSMAQFR